MIEKNKRQLDESYKDDIFGLVCAKYGVKEPSANMVLDYLLGDEAGYIEGEYTISKYIHTRDTLINRFNLIWITPLYVITIPLQYLFIGQIGVTRNNKFGRLILRLIGET